VTNIENSKPNTTQTFDQAVADHGQGRQISATHADADGLVGAGNPHTTQAGGAGADFDTGHFDTGHFDTGHFDTGHFRRRDRLGELRHPVFDAASTLQPRLQFDVQ